MPSVQIEISNEVLLSLKESPESMGRSIRFLAAAKLVELAKLSTGRAADLAGMGRVEFLLALRDLGVSPAMLSFSTVVEDAGHARVFLDQVSCKFSNC
ncbi:MAG: UPF0175 family protein [Sumerlaeia bacterium]